MSYPALPPESAAALGEIGAEPFVARANRSSEAAPIASSASLSRAAGHDWSTSIDQTCLNTARTIARNASSWSKAAFNIYKNSTVTAYNWARSELAPAEGSYLATAFDYAKPVAKVLPIALGILLIANPVTVRSLAINLIGLTAILGTLHAADRSNEANLQAKVNVLKGAALACAIQGLFFVGKALLRVSLPGLLLNIALTAISTGTCYYMARHFENGIPR